LNSARKTQSSVTGKTPLFEFCPSNAALGYGQNAAFWDLPVKCGSRLRAKRRFLNSARKRQLSVTGKTPLFEFCP